VKATNRRRIFTRPRQPNRKLEALAGALCGAIVAGTLVSAQLPIGTPHQLFHVGYGPFVALAALTAAFAFGLHVGRPAAVFLAAIPLAVVVALAAGELDGRHGAASSVSVGAGFVGAVALVAGLGVAARRTLRPR
jgi:hypothetical protein